jgi:prepilin peptidase CpaA
MSFFDLPPVDPGLFLWFLPLTVPIAVWVSWSDMKFMKIPNKAVMALAAVWAATGWIVLPWQVWLAGFALMVVVLVAGFLINAVNLVGAGDAKFAAAMAPFFTTGDVRLLMALFAACLLAAFFAHRLVRMVPAVRRATADWVSWTAKKFPMGLALSGTLIFFPLLASFSS